MKRGGGQTIEVDPEGKHMETEDDIADDGITIACNSHTKDGQRCLLKGKEQIRES